MAILSKCQRMMQAYRKGCQYGTVEFKDRVYIQKPPQNSCTEWRLVWPPHHADIAYFDNFSHSWHGTFIGSHIQNGLFFLPIYSLSFFNIFFLQRNFLHSQIYRFYVKNIRDLLWWCC